LVVDKGGPLYRIHAAKQAPLYFGKTKDNRFDAPAGEYGVLYAAFTPQGAFVETFGHDTGTRVLDERELSARALATIHPSRPLRLVDLTGKGLARLGADARLLAGEHEDAQPWSRAFHDQPEKVDGVLYLARHDPSRQCAAIFDRAKTVISASPLGSLVDAKLHDLVRSLLDEYDFGLV